MAEQRLRLIILGELSAWGIPCDSEAVDKIIAGLPKDTLYKLLAELT